MTGTSNVHGLSRTSASAAVPMPARRWRTRLLLPAAIVVMLFGLAAYGAWDTIAPATEVRAVSVVVKAMAAETPGTVTVQAPGWLEPDPHPHYVPALTGGVVDRVLVLEGQAVEAGQVVAHLIDDDAKLLRERAAADLDARRGEVAAAEAEVEAARVTLESLVDRTEAVDRARADLEAIVAERAQLDAEIAAAEAVAGATQDEVDRKTKLVASRAVARGEVERLRLRLVAERAALDATRARIPVLAARNDAATARHRAAVRHTELLIEERRALAAAAAQLDQARAAERRATAALAEADLALARTEIRTATAGIVLERLVAPGSRVQVTSGDHSSHVVHLYDPARLQVRVDVPLADAARVGLGQRVEIVVDALPDEVFAGTVTRLVHLADIAKNTVEVKVAVTNPRPVLKPEMLARVRFLAHDGAARDADSHQAQRVFAPRRAVQRGDSGDRVLVVTDVTAGRGRAAVRPVTLGSVEIDDHVEITTGLRPGDRVIVDAPDGLAAGDRVIVTGGDR